MNGMILLTGENAKDWVYPISKKVIYEKEDRGIEVKVTTGELQPTRYNEKEEADWRVLMEHNLNEEDLINRKISAKEIYEELGLLGVAQLSPPEKEILILYGCLKIRDGDWGSLSDVLQELIRRYGTVDVIIDRAKQKADEKRNRKYFIFTHPYARECKEELTLGCSSNNFICYHWIQHNTQ